MKTVLILITVLFMLTAFAQGNGKAKGHAKTNDPYTTKPAPQERYSRHPTTNPNSNAPGTVDRDLGRDRALESGKGKKKGLYKTNRGRTGAAARG
jgi:hypothetical protein